MLNSIWLKLSAALGVAVAILLSIVGYRGRKIDELEHEAKIEGKIKENAKKQIKDEREVLKNEPEQIDNEIKARRNSSKSDRINRL